MSFRLPIRLIVAIALIAIPAPAHAWGAKGHRIVCTLAWDSIDENARSRIRVILTVSTREQFAETCVQPDRNHAGEPAIPRSHAMLVPLGATSLDRRRDCPSGCILREIERTIGILAGQAPEAEKAVALPLLSHLVADAHQPLNMGFLDDQGGVTLGADFRGKTTTMRKIWEEHLLDAAPEPNAPNGILKIYGLLFQVGGPREYWIQATPFDWVKESFFIMRTPATGYVGNAGGLSFDDAYVKQNQIVALEQIQKAATRLAHLLPALVTDPKRKRAPE